MKTTAMRVKIHSFVGEASLLLAANSVQCHLWIISNLDRDYLSSIILCHVKLRSSIAPATKHYHTMVYPLAVG